MSDDRLRRLDALFAERVLGFTAGMHDWPTPVYTRSLGAAWEGATSKGWFVDVAGPYEENKEYMGTVYTDEPNPFNADSTHPAEALVLACLRAVGCGEEELK